MFKSAAVQISDTVSFHRPGYHFTHGEVLTIDEGTNRALVQWMDQAGRTLQMLCGLEYLTVETATALTVETVNAA